jgi:hypothetical protein
MSEATISVEHFQRITARVSRYFQHRFYVRSLLQCSFIDSFTEWRKSRFFRWRPDSLRCELHSTGSGPPSDLVKDMDSIWVKKVEYHANTCIRTYV